MQRYLVPQLKLMSRRLWTIICWPSAVLATGFAVWLLLLNPGLLFMQWMLIKLGFVGLLIGISSHYPPNVSCALQRDQNTITPPTLCVCGMKGQLILLFAIIFLAILKTSFDWIYGLDWDLLAWGMVLMLGIRLYKRSAKSRTNYAIKTVITSAYIYGDDFLGTSLLRCLSQE